MATQEKLLKSLETLKNLMTSNQVSDLSARKKEKIQHCNFITEAMSNSTIKIAPNFSNLLTFSIETFLKLADDSESDIRMIADECLNRIIKAMSNGNIGKVQIELHKEIKKNGAARSLRAALTRFSLLSHLIRPHKGKPYVVNLLPCIVKIIERDEELIHETLANSLPNIMGTLGCFTTDNDIKALLKAFLSNIQKQSTVIRRTAASCILTICLNCRKPHVFITYVLNNLLDNLMSLEEESSTCIILGIFGSLKTILPHVQSTVNDQEMLGSFGIKKQINETPLATDRLLQVYEVCVYYICHKDHNVVNAALETLNILLLNVPRELKAVLVSSKGITKSNLSFGEPNLLSKQRSCSRLSLATTLVLDDTIPFESDLTESLKPDIEKWIDESKLSVISVTYTKMNESKQSLDITDTSGSSFETIENSDYSNITIGAISDIFGDTAKNDESLVNNLDNMVLSESSSEKSYLQVVDEKSTLSTFDEDIYEEIDIGKFTDNDIPLIYATRLISKSFLLTGNASCTIPDKKVRVSVKNLALSCLSTIIRIYPNAFLMYLHKNCAKDSAKSKQCISDVLLFENHPDPQLRGAVRILVGSFLKCVLLANEGDYDSWILKNSLVKENDAFQMQTLLNYVLKGLEDESSHCTRQSLVGLNICLKYIIESKHCNSLLGIFKIIPMVSKNPYWLVKVKLLEIISEIKYISVQHIIGTCVFQNHIIYNILFELLKDEDQRVRSACSMCIMRIIPNLYFQQDNCKESTITYKAILDKNELLAMLDHIQLETSISKRTFIENMPFPFCAIDKSNNNPRVEEALSRILLKLHEYLLTSTSKYFIFGCIETLSLLSAHYPTTSYVTSWSCFKNFNVRHEKNLFQRSISTSGSASVIQENAINSSSDLFNVCVNLLQYSTFGYDFSFQLHILKITGNLFAGKCFQNIKPVGDLNLENSNELWDMFTDKNLSELSEQFLSHVVKLLNIFSHVLEEVAPMLPQTKSTLPALPSASNLSPLKRRKSDLGEKARIISPVKSPEKDDKNDKRDVKASSMGSFAHSPHYMRIYDLLKIAYNNYKVTLDVNASENFLGLLKTALNTLSQILEIATLVETARVSEEILYYLRSTFTLEPTSTVECVQQLLKSLFGSNFTSNISEILLFLNKNHKEEQHDKFGFYYNIFQKPYSDLSDCIKGLHSVNKKECEGDSVVMGYLHRRDATKKISLTKGSDKILASYIRIFEPMVIKSLKQYTITSDVKLQSRVLQLLSQLVQLRVNYCLLDSEKIFIAFVLKQFEFIEEGQMPYAYELIPKIFQFLVYLSYDKQHSKSIISVPKLIQLCDGLMASGQSPITHCIPALKPIVEDIFMMRNKSNTQDLKELETTREVLISMLLRLLEYNEVMELLCMILNESKYCDNSERWYRWSKQIVDVLIPKLRQNKIRLDDIESYHSLKKLIFMLNFEAFKSTNEIVVTLFQDPPCLDDPLISFTRWLGKIIILLLILSQTKEETFLTKILQSKQEFGLKSVYKSVPVNTDPLKNCDCYEGLSPELIFNRFVFGIVEICVEKILETAKNEENAFVVQKFALFLMYCLHIFQSGSHCKTANAAINLINDESELKRQDIDLEKINATFVKISAYYPVLAFEWCYLLTLLNYNKADFWSSVMHVEENNDLINEKTYLNLEITKVGAVIVYCDFLTENLSSNQLGWFLRHNMTSLINLCIEAPVFELIGTINRNCHAASLLLQVISSKCINVTDPLFKIKILKAIENIHSSQVGSLLKLLVYDLLDSKELALCRSVANLASRKIEYLLTLSMEDVHNQLTREDLVKITDFLVNNKLAKKHETLTSLLNKLRTQYYDLSPFEIDQRRPINPAYIKKLQIHKNWYLSQIKLKCESVTVNQEVAELLNPLDYDDLEFIMHSETFNKRLLRECMLYGLDEVRKCGLHTETQLLKASINNSLQEVARLMEELPNPHYVFKIDGRTPSTLEETFTAKMLELFAEKRFFTSFAHMIPTVSLYVSSLSIFPSHSIPESNYEHLSQFAVVCLESVNYLISAKRNVNINFVDLAVNCADCILKVSDASGDFSLDARISWLCSCINSIYEIVNYLLLQDKPLPILAKDCLKNTLSVSSTACAGHACHQLAVLIAWLEDIQSSKLLMSKFLFQRIKSIVISLSRSTLVNSFILTPPSFWKLGGEIELSGPFLTEVPPLPIKFLQEVEILEEFIFRITLLGWTSRQQYEETWMSLLSVLSATPDESSDPEDINTFTHTTSLAVQTITALLIQTLYIPVAGNKNTSQLLHISRDRVIEEKSASVRKLKIVQRNFQNDYMKYYSKCLSHTENLINVFDKRNLEKQNQEYSYGQLSLEYLLISSKTVDPTDDNNPAFRLFQEREKMLQESGLDVNSCLQFLLDLYSQWIKEQPPAPLRLIQEVVKSILIISDLFTERTQFYWMLESCMELSKVHIIEDDIIHQYLVIAICKAASVLTPDIETYTAIQKIVSQTLRSSFLPARISTLHGILYILQGCVLGNTVIGGISDETQLFLPTILQYIRCNISVKNSLLNQSQEHHLLLWSLSFYLIENIEENNLDADFSSYIVQEAISNLTSTKSCSILNNSLLKGLETLIIKQRLSEKLREQVMKLALEKMKNKNSLTALPAMQLLMSCMYTECSDQLENTEKSNGIVQSNPDNLVQTIEKVYAIFDRIKRGYPFEVEILCAVLPTILSDFFPPSDILTKVIGEFLAPQQRHVKLLSRVVFQVFEKAIEQSQLSLLQDWVVFSLSNFTQSLPLGMATWCLTCFFISASTNSWLRALFPYIQSRIGRYEYEDRKMLCIAGADFYKNLITEKQKKTFIDTFNKVKDQVDTPFSDLLSSL